MCEGLIRTMCYMPQPGSSGVQPVKKKITLQKAKCTSAIVCTGASVCSGFRAARMPPCVRSACAGMHISFCACAEIRASRRECERTRGLKKKERKSHPTRVSKPPRRETMGCQIRSRCKTRTRAKARARTYTHTHTHKDTVYRQTD